MTNQGEMTVSGTIKAIGPEQQVSASYNKREVVVTTDEQLETLSGSMNTTTDLVPLSTADVGPSADIE